MSDDELGKIAFRASNTDKTTLVWSKQSEEHKHHWIHIAKAVASEVLLSVFLQRSGKIKPTCSYSGCPIDSCDRPSECSQFKGCRFLYVEGGQ